MKNNCDCCYMIKHYLNHKSNFATYETYFKISHIAYSKKNPINELGEMTNAIFRIKYCPVCGKKIDTSLDIK